MFAGKPVIGIVGGIGSGKSHVSRLFGQEGCLVIDSDEQVRRAYQREDVKRTLRQWWGDDVIDGAGNVNRPAIAQRIFGDPAERKRLEGLLHPLVAELRRQEMEHGGNDPRVRAFVWDTPLLVETGLHKACDAVVFVEAPVEERCLRVMQQRRWEQGELQRREKLQMALDKKRELANYIVRNTAGADDEVRSQIREVLSRILAGSKGEQAKRS